MVRSLFVGVSHAHRRAGDLKPANFLFVRGTLKLIDFGIAKAIQSDETNHVYHEKQIGTLNYMSPEAISGTAPNKLRCGRVSYTAVRYSVV